MAVMDFIFVAVGLIALVFAGDFLVRGAVALSLRLGIPALVVSLTVVAFGTSAPELLVAVSAALEGAPGIAFGNVVGSNTANVLLVVGVPAVISTIATQGCKSNRNYVMMLGASALFIGLCFTGPLMWWHGVVMLSVLSLVLFDAYRSARASGGADGACEMPELAEIEDADPHMPGWKISVLLIAGLIGLPLGAHLLVEGAQNIARHMGVPETVIGLTLVAIGTSLPELATTVMAALRKHTDVIMGNVIGSNLFNLLAIMGVASFFGPLEVPPSLLTVDLWVMLGASLLLAPFVWQVANVTRWWGAFFVAVYSVYVALMLV